MINVTPGPYEAGILADSISPEGVRLTTMVVNFPRFVLAEFNTHRVFSRNSASSRAIPVKTRIKMIDQDPFVPLSFGKNKRGMSSTEDLEGDEAAEAEKIWRRACRDAVKSAKQLADLGVHKQFANRILEPFAFHTVIVTSTEWDNFFALRDSKFAQPEICLPAQNMKKVYNESKPEELNPGDWHLPLIFEEDYNEFLYQDGFNYKQLAKISCARCARVSYLTHDGVRSIDKDLELFDRLTTAGHMSPLEHAAECGAETTFMKRDFIGNFRSPWVQYRKMIPGEDVFNG